MQNEILLILSIPLYFGAFLLLFKLFGRLGAFMWVVLATLFANIEVLLVVDAFGMQMTLGNVLFGSTFLATDVLSERYGKKSANLAVKLGVTTSIIYILFSQFWLLFTPSSSDWAYDAFNTLFSSNVRLLLTGLIVYFIAQKVDIFIYHYVWDTTNKITNSRTKMLWARNLASTITTQFINSILFTYLAFGNFTIGNLHISSPYGYENSTVFNIFITGWVIMTVIAIIDTPFVYLCRKLKTTEYNIIKE